MEGQPSQQQLYMTPQSENLSYLYELMDKLMLQLKHNQAEKNKILENVDRLSAKVNNINSVTQKEDHKGCLNSFEIFLKGHRKHQPDIFNDLQEAEDIEDILTKQNVALKQKLKETQLITMENYDILKYHEECLHEVIGYLRADILRDHREMLDQIRHKYNEELIPLEESEFENYIASIEEIQKLMDISKIYRMLLKWTTKL